MVACNAAKKAMGRKILIMGTPEQTKFMIGLLDSTPVRRRVILEPNARTTAEMALLSAPHVMTAASSRKQDEVVIVTSSNHASRAKILFDERLGLSCGTETVERSGVSYSRVEEREKKKIDRILVLQAIFRR